METSCDQFENTLLIQPLRLIIKLIASIFRFLMRMEKLCISEFLGVEWLRWFGMVSYPFNHLSVSVSMTSFMVGVSPNSCSES